MHDPTAEKMFACLMSLKGSPAWTPEIDAAALAYAVACNDRNRAAADEEWAPSEDMKNRLWAVVFREGGRHVQLSEEETIVALRALRPMFNPQAARDEIQYWRNDAFEAAAGIVARYFGADIAKMCANDIRAMKHATPYRRAEVTT